jgi:hypothetical protein
VQTAYVVPRLQNPAQPKGSKKASAAAAAAANVNRPTVLPAGVPVSSLPAAAGPGSRAAKAAAPPGGSGLAAVAMLIEFQMSWTQIRC